MILARTPRAAFSLIEVTIAIGIAAFCLITIFALLPVGVTTNRTSVNNTVAAGLASGIVADLRAAPLPTSTTSAGTSPLYGITPDTATEKTLYLKSDGSVSGSAADADYAALVKITKPATSPGATPVYIKISWPGSLAPDKSTTFFEVVTALDRNS
jgi:uncharacterized protein (TIGR02598 family)